MATNRFQLSRRTMLRGLAGLTGVAVGLPFLDAMEGQRASAGSFPKRLVIFFTPNGTIPDAWVASGGTETNFKLGPILQPLAKHQSDLIVLTGLNNEAARHGPGDDHQRGIGTMLTGTELLTGSYKGGCDTCPGAGFAGGPSVDQVVAKQLGQKTKLPSMEFGVHVHDSDDWSRMSYSGPNTPMPPVDDPGQAYDRLFKDLNTDPTGQKQLVQQRHMVLNSVMSDAQKLRNLVGKADQLKLDQHLASLDTINKHLDTVVSVGGSCKAPVKPAGYGNIYDGTHLEAIGKLQMDMMVMALTCDITRVASIQWTRSVGDVVFSWLGCTSGHHTLSHLPSDDANGRAQLIKINAWYAQQLDYLITQMKAIPEGTGTLLDNTAILWCNELAVGNAHSHNDMRFLLAGGAGGAFKTGRLLNYKGDPHNNLLVSLCNAMDVPVSTFGNPLYCKGPLASL